MLSQPEVIEVKKPVFPLLLYPDPGKPYRQRLGQYLKRIDAGTSNVNGSSPCMAARCFLSPSILWRGLRKPLVIVNGDP